MRYVDRAGLFSILGFGTLVIAIPSVASALMGPLTEPQLIALFIFSVIIAGSLFYWQFRNAFAFIGISCLLLLQVIDLEHLINFSALHLVLFLVGMMIIVGFLEEHGLFDYLVGRFLIPLAPRPALMIACLLLTGTMMAALVDEVTSILFMSTVMVKVLEGYGITGRRVLPFLMFLVFTTNIGSSALPIGNPIGVFIAFQAGFSIADFVQWPLPLAVLSSLIVTSAGLMYLRRTVGGNYSSLPLPGPGSPLGSAPLMTGGVRCSLLIFVLLIAGLAIQVPIESALGLPTNQLLLVIPLLLAGTVLIIDRDHAPRHVERIDWWTLLYFLFLFASVGSLSYTGLTGMIADDLALLDLTPAAAVLLVGGTIAVLTAFMDNIVAVAAVAPVVNALTSTGIDTDLMWWAMLIGGTYCGNATIIGSTANIVMAGKVEREGLGQFPMREWTVVGTALSAITFLLAIFILLLRGGLLPLP